jgi:hypothetical protein
MHMRTSWTTAAGGMIIALLALAPRSAAAQYNPFDRADAPAHVHNFTGGTVRELESQFEYDVHVMGVFSGMRRRMDRFEQVPTERPQPWMFYGRLGPMHFHNQLEPKPHGFQFSFRRQGPTLGGRVYIGIHKTFN